jgi:DNA-binding MarR family transcriptional regulator
MTGTGVTTDRTPDKGDDGLVEGLLGVTQQVANVLAAVAARHDLTPQQVRLLRTLDGPISMRACANDRSCDPSNVTGLVDRVERLGLVERVSDPRDRRVRMLVLTAKGRLVRDRVIRDIADGVEQTLGLTAQNRSTVARLLETMNASERRWVGYSRSTC